MRDKNLYIPLVIVWLAASAWRPLAFGFFSDDWCLLTGGARSPVSLHDFFGIHALRPFYGFMSWLGSLAFGGTIRFWTVASSLIVLVTALCLVHYLRHLLVAAGIEDKAASKAAFLGATMWLVSPFSVVATTWPTCSITLIALCLCCLGTTLLFHPRLLVQLFAATTLAVSFLAYEAYVFLCPASLLLVMAWRRRPFLRPFCLFAGALVTVIAYKELAPLLFPGLVAKSLNVAWASLFMNNAFEINRFVDQAFSPFTRVLYLLAALYACVVAFLSGSGAIRVVVLLLIMISAYFSSALLYAVVGYGFAGAGVMARTTNGPLLYMTLAFTGSLALSLEGLRRKDRRLRIRTISLWGLTACLVLTSAAANLVRSYEWMDIWNRERSIISQFPSHSVSELISRGRVPAVIIVDVADDSDGQVFGASWEITGALSASYPQFNQALRDNTLFFLPARSGFFQTRWNHGVIEQRLCYDTNILIESRRAAQGYYVSLGRNSTASVLPFDLEKVIACH